MEVRKKWPSRAFLTVIPDIVNIIKYLVEYIDRYLGQRTDISEYEEHINEQMKAYDEREQKVSSSNLIIQLNVSFSG